MQTLSQRGCRGKSQLWMFSVCGFNLLQKENAGRGDGSMDKPLTMHVWGTGLRCTEPTQKPSSLPVIPELWEQRYTVPSGKLAAWNSQIGELQIQ